MKRIGFAVLALFLLAGVFACTDGAQTMFESAQLEELQNNPQHAEELYEVIVRKYPGTEYARMAEERLNDLRGSTR